MILYTPLPIELVTKGIEDLPKTQELTYHGVLMEVKPLSFGSAKIVKVISTDPKDYLKYTPGEIIQYEGTESHG